MIRHGCGSCLDKQIMTLEAASGGKATLCPLMARLAMNSRVVTPPIERHFLNLARGCATETHGTGGLYVIQQVQGSRAVGALVTIKEAIAPSDQEGRSEAAA